MKWTTIVAATLLLAACPKKDAPPPPPAAPPPSDEVRPVYADRNVKRDAAAEKLCAALHGVSSRKQAKCCGQAETTSPLQNECVVALSSAIAAGAASLDAARVEACVAALDAATTGCEWVGPRGAPAPDACRDLVVGKLAAGAKCRSSLECPRGTHCAGAGPTDPGVCAPPSGVGSGCGRAVDALAALALQGDVEPQHPECDGACIRGKCRAFVPAGGACASSIECGAGAACVDGKCGAAPPAVAAAAAGGACTTDFDCAAGGCVGGKCGMKCTTWRDVAAAARPKHLRDGGAP